MYDIAPVSRSGDYSSTHNSNQAHSSDFTCHFIAARSSVDHMVARSNGGCGASAKDQGCLIILKCVGCHHSHARLPTSSSAF